MTITDINDVRRRRELIREAAQWAFNHLPWTSGALTTDFAQRWPDFTISERMAIAAEIEKISEPLSQRFSDRALDTSRMTGREECWQQAADWLTANSPDISHPEFARLFGHISRSEIFLAIIERERRQVQGS